MRVNGRSTMPSTVRVHSRWSSCGGLSVVCELNLKGFEYELAVISGRAENVQRMERLIAQRGELPEQWLAAFRAEVERKDG